MPDAPVDAATLAELLETVGGDQDFLAELVETYRADCPRLLVELRAAVAAGEASAARRAAHTLKSTSASMGALGLAAQCREIEAAAAAGDLAGLDERVERVAATYDEVEAALRAAVASGEAS
jgi:HPt (histidine-containing phosphotransfer) domain-containing protein